MGGSKGFAHHSPLLSDMPLSQALRVSILASVRVSLGDPASDDCLLQVKDVAHVTVDKSRDNPSCIVQHCTDPNDPCPDNAAYAACVEAVMVNNDGLPEHDVAINQATLIPPDFTPEWSSSFLLEENADLPPGTGPATPLALLEDEVEGQVVGVRLVTSGRRWSDSSGKVQVDLRCADGLWRGSSEASNNPGPFAQSTEYTMIQTLPVRCGWPGMIRLTVLNNNAGGFKQITVFRGSDFSTSDKTETVIDKTDTDGTEYGTNPFWLDGNEFAGNGKQYVVPNADLPWKAFDYEARDNAPDAEAVLIGVRSKTRSKRRLRLDDNQKVYIQNQPILGAGAGEGSLGVCRELAGMHVTNSNAPYTKVCGTGIKATFFLRGRCAGYYENSRVVGKCNTGSPPSTCDSFGPNQDQRFAHYQSYLIEQCPPR